MIVELGPSRFVDLERFTHQGENLRCLSGAFCFAVAQELGCDIGEIEDSSESHSIRIIRLFEDGSDLTNGLPDRFRKFPLLQQPGARFNVRGTEGFLF